MDVFPYFFTPTMVFFDDCLQSKELYKPTLDLSRNEALIEYKSKSGYILLIQYLAPKSIDIIVRSDASFVPIFKDMKDFSQITYDNLEQLPILLQGYYSSMQEKIFSIIAPSSPKKK